MRNGEIMISEEYKFSLECVQYHADNAMALKALFLGHIVALKMQSLAECIELRVRTVNGRLEVCNLGLKEDGSIVIKIVSPEVIIPYLTGNKEGKWRVFNRPLPSRYIKKGCIVEAMQLVEYTTSDGIDKVYTIINWILDNNGKCFFNDEDGLIIETTIGKKEHVKPKDYIVNLGDGVFIVYPDRYFNRYYETHRGDKDV